VAANGRRLGLRGSSFCFGSATLALSGAFEVARRAATVRALARRLARRLRLRIFQRHLGFARRSRAEVTLGGGFLADFPVGRAHASDGGIDRSVAPRPLRSWGPLRSRALLHRLELIGLGRHIPPILLGACSFGRGNDADPSAARNAGHASPRLPNVRFRPKDPSACLRKGLFATGPPGEDPT
jgi:hypothetical protein